MEISLELDDFESEPEEVNDNTDEVIKEYLKGKLEDAKRLSEIAEQQMNKMKELQHECLQDLKENENFDDALLIVKNTWQKIYNEKWIIGIYVENSMQSAAENINIIFECIPKQDLNYSVKIFNKYREEIPEELNLLQKDAQPEFVEALDHIKSSFDDIPRWVCSSNLQKESVIIVLLEIPKFINIKEFIIKGIITYEINKKKFQKPISTFCLKIQDILSDEFSIKKENIIEGIEDSFLSCVAAGELTNVKIIIPEGSYSTPEGVLQIDCCFTKINIPAQEMILVFNGNSHRLEYSMVKIIPGKQELQLITKNEEQLHLLFHHLYQNIPDVIILTEKYEQITDNSIFVTGPTQSFLESTKQNQNTVRDFIDSFDLQLQFLKKTCDDNIKCEHDNFVMCKTQDDCQKFRSKLSDLERRTDEVLLKIFDKK